MHLSAIVQILYVAIIIIGILVLILGIENPSRVWAAAPHRRG